MKMVSFYQTVRKQPFLKKYMRKRLRNNNRVIWLSLGSIGISALVMGAGRRQNYNTLLNFIKRFTPKKPAPIFNNAFANEFSEELLAGALNNGKSGQQGRS